MNSFNIKVSPRLVALWLALVASMPALQGVAQALECYDCHGTRSTADVRPEDAAFRNPSSGGFQGSHRTHMGPDSTRNACAKCHPGSDNSDLYTSSHRNGYIKLSSRINGSQNITQYPSNTPFNNITSPWLQSYNPLFGSCSNVNCHFEKETKDLAKGINGWGDPPLNSLDNCNFCHAAAPKDGHHPGNQVNGQDKHGDFLGKTASSCTKCHADHSSTINFSHATSVGRRSLAVQFNNFANSGGTYSGYSGSLTEVLPSQRASDKRNGTCSDLYCHSDARGNAGLTSVKWNSNTSTQCYSCHRGRTARSFDAAPQVNDNTRENCEPFGSWSATKGFCTTDLVMSSNGHHLLVGPKWVRKYPCYYCHNKTVATDGTLTNLSSTVSHVNGKVDIAMAPLWNMANRSSSSYTYDPVTKKMYCNNVYCHSDGTADPEKVRPFPWDKPKTDCNSCHGHPTGECIDCHNGTRRFVINNVTTTLKVRTNWPVGQEWLGALPMFPNQGPGSPRANSHPRHAQTNFSCDECHADTVLNGSCQSCHDKGIPAGEMKKTSHINAEFHVNKKRDVSFKRNKELASYDKDQKTCSRTGRNSECHAGTVPVWGGSARDSVVCLTCHGATNDFDVFAGTFGNHSTPAKINTTEWTYNGHGRYSSNGPGGVSGRYPVSNNPAANFGSNPCWYCHDPNILHNMTSSNPFRLRLHAQYENRFEKECVYCHMQGNNTECKSCHVGQTESLSPQATIGGIVRRLANTSTVTYYPTHKDVDNCINPGCHDSDDKTHKTSAGVWTLPDKIDIKNQYMMMGVCLQCHDDDSGGQCTSCHQPPASDPLKYSVGFNPKLPGTRFIKPKKARASGSHFGYKHYRAATNDKVWKGGKFCWDCHDPHGDKNYKGTYNIYMIQREVATSTDGKFGKPLTRRDVVFTARQSGKEYANSDKNKPYEGICNVCHTAGKSKHYTSTSGDKHNESRRCTDCHEHRFADSHANKQLCTACHKNSKPSPKHGAFGLPRDCTKCHASIIGGRMNVMAQLVSNSHHIQGPEVHNTHCYVCHWESTKDGLIDIKYHEGYNYKIYTSVKNAKVDLVLAKPKERPTFYSITSAVQFLAINIGKGPLERIEAGKVSKHCISCHSDQNNEWMPFNDCKTPNQYAWDYQSIDARYSQFGAEKTTTWGKVNSTNFPKANQKDKIVKSFSAHGNPKNNYGGINTSTGIDESITSTRGGASAEPVQCYDCHSSHGSSLVGTTSSYLTYNGTKNGANLKETQAGNGGYSMAYKATFSNATGVGFYNAGAGQCFDCHLKSTSGTTPWGYNTTFGATAAIMGYKDTEKFGQGIKASTARFTERASRKTILGGHMKASVPIIKDSGVVGSGTNNTTTLSAAKSWVPRKWINNYVLMLSGDNANLTRKITDNTNTTLTFEAFGAAVKVGDTFKIVPYADTINGLCTPCHDPHGVSPTLGDNQKYAVPLLKGTWMTSPYKEDAPPIDPVGAKASKAPFNVGTPMFADNRNISWGNAERHNNHPNADEQPWTKHNLDHNTFDPSATIKSNKIPEDDAKFAGLCMRCHTRKALLGNYTGAIGGNYGPNKAPWKSVERIHAATKGWGVNSEHSFPCSKCHQPHNSGLPRLMQTNCLDSKHRGGRASGGKPWAADMQVKGTFRQGNAHYWDEYRGGREHRGFPLGSMYGERYTSPEATTACHVGKDNPIYDSRNPPAAWPDGNEWNSRTLW